MHVSFNHVHVLEIHEFFDHQLHVMKTMKRVEILHEGILIQIFQELMSF